MEKPVEVKEEAVGAVAHNVTCEEEKERKPRSHPGGRNFGQGERSHYRNWKSGNNWRKGGRHTAAHKSGWKPVSAEALSLESILAREDKPIVFDLSIGRDKLELNEWFKSYAPSKIRRSDGIGWIMVLSEQITNEEKKFLFEREENHMALTEEWRTLTLEPDNVVNFQTIKDLALKHDCKGGKWICHPSGPQLDEIWQRTVLAMTYGKLADGVIATKISPINDIDIPGGNSRGGARSNDHVLCIITRDMTNEGQVLQIEKTLRAIPITSDMQYKPNIYSQLGIYRKNKYRLRPTIYSSSKDKDGENQGYKVESVVDQNWSYASNEDVMNNNLTIDDLKEKLNHIRTVLSEVCKDMAKLEVKNVDEEVPNDVSKPLSLKVNTEGTEVTEEIKKDMLEPIEKQEVTKQDPPEKVDIAEEEKPKQDGSDNDANPKQEILGNEAKPNVPDMDEKPKQDVFEKGEKPKQNVDVTVKDEKPKEEFSEVKKETDV